MLWSSYSATKQTARRWRTGTGGKAAVVRCYVAAERRSEKLAARTNHEAWMLAAATDRLCDLPPNSAVRSVALEARKNTAIGVFLGRCLTSRRSGRRSGFWCVNAERVPAWRRLCLVLGSLGAGFMLDLGDASHLLPTFRPHMNHCCVAGTARSCLWTVIHVGRCSY